MKNKILEIKKDLYQQFRIQNRNVKIFFVILILLNIFQIHGGLVVEKHKNYIVGHVVYFHTNQIFSQSMVLIDLILNLITLMELGTIRVETGFNEAYKKYIIYNKA